MVVLVAFPRVVAMLQCIRIIRHRDIKWPFESVTEPRAVGGLCPHALASNALLSLRSSTDHAQLRNSLHNIYLIEQIIKI